MSPTRIVLVIFLFLSLNACTPPKVAAPTLAPIPATALPLLATAPAKRSNTVTPSPLPPTATHTATLTPTALPTLSPTAAATVMYDTLRKTPPTLMLHRSNMDFDAVAFLEGFVQILQEKQYRVVTYMDITRQPDITASEEGRLFIITIDDISLQAKIDPSILDMIGILREAHYPAVLGIITEGLEPDQETVGILKTLAEEGWELAIHTENHTNLHELEQTSSYGARLEIRTCSDKIYKYTNVRPISVVLPYGAMVENLKIMYRENVTWAVGIAGGEKYRTTNHIYYVGREGPAGTPARTYDAIMARFLP